MPRIKTESLQQGMVVAVDVKNIDGMLLLPSGCSLTERHINILQSWGVDEVDIEAAEGVEDTKDPLSRLPPEVLAQWTAEARSLFWELDESNPAAMEVFNLMLRRRAKRGHAR